MKRNILWIMAVVMSVLVACAPAARATDPAATPSPTFTVLNACDILTARDAFIPMGEPMAIIEEIPAGEVSSEFGFVSRCVYAGADPVSTTLLTLQITQTKPGLEVASIEEIAERYLRGMEQAGVTRHEVLDEFGEAAFWLPETQTMSVFMEDGTGVIVSIEPVNENAREVARQVVEKIISTLGY